MLLRLELWTATSLIVGFLGVSTTAEPFNRAAARENPFIAPEPAKENPFGAPPPPLDRRFAEWRRALGLSHEQEKLFSAMERQLRQAAEERVAAIVAAAIDRNREQLPRDPGEQLRARADRLSRHAESLRALADAESSFFASLSDDQRLLADQILPRDVLGMRDLFRRRGMRADRNG